MDESALEDDELAALAVLKLAQEMHELEADPHLITARATAYYEWFTHRHSAGKPKH